MRLHAAQRTLPQRSPSWVSLPAQIPTQRSTYRSRLLHSAPRKVLSPRGQEMEAIVGRPANGFEPVRRAIDDVTHRQWLQTMVPLIRAHWPDLLSQTSPDRRIYRKLQYLTERLYGRCEYLMFFFATQKPLIYRALITLGNHLPNWLTRLAPHGAALGIRMFYQFSGLDRHRLIILSAAIVAVFDEAFDRSSLPAAERADFFKRAIRGQAPIDCPALKLTRALYQQAEEIARRKSDKRFLNYFLTEVMRASDHFASVEAQAILGAEDPTGQDFRLGGPQAGVAAFSFAVDPDLGPDERSLFIRLSLIAQMVDDWIDYDKDRAWFDAGGRPTPVISGKWTHDSIRGYYNDTMTIFNRLLARHGIKSPKFAQLCTLGMQDLFHQMLTAMDLGVAD